MQRTIQLTEDATITAVLTGDLSTTLSKQIVMGERSDLALAAPADPVWAGPVAFPYTLTNTGILPTTLPLAFALDGTPVLEREATVMPGQFLADVLWVEMTPGTHLLAASTPYEQEAASTTAQTRELVQVSIEQVIAPLEMIGRTPVSTTVTNVGNEPVRGVLLCPDRLRSGRNLAGTGYRRD